ncbi:MAG: type II CRISPR RNA-guided endonuclease Cas9 [Lachnospiraceae bacterium]|nr:type II CRISPR RNA-guided endonuclease Cas9 [Lachnospiraceae bacterium]
MGKESKKMYVGIDMGTNSVGMAVTDENYNLYRVKGKDFWCSRVFAEANTAAERRINRTSRRRRQREVARQGVLREFFSCEINKVDEGFFARLDESKYYMEDRDNQQPYTLFADDGYTDKDYFKDYPTIFHLRNELLHPTKDTYDVRLVYLAIANMFKHRGHFLNETLDVEKISSGAEEVYQFLVEAAMMYAIELPTSVDVEQLVNIISEKGVSRSKHLENAGEYLGISKKDKQAYEMLKLICGMSGILFNIYGEEVIDEENKKFSLNFRDSNYEEKEGQAFEILGDDYFELLEIIKEFHDICMLSSIIKGNKYLSESRVELFEEHKKDRKMLQSVLKKYDMKAYNEMFRVMKEGNYSAYVGSVNAHGKKVRRNGGKGRSEEDFYKTVKKVIGNFPEDDENVKTILAKIENETFMPKQLTVSNGVIPNQLHASEMKAILTNAEKYLPFLLDKDESGLTVSQRILQLFTFHIPYYIGPIGAVGDNVWAKRRPGEEKGKVYPWNFEQKIDMQNAAEEFIGRMVRHCTYLTGERTLPKQSLLYEKFMVLNELNNLKINGAKPDVDVKQGIYENLFKTGKKVTLNVLENYLYNNSIIQSKDDVVISGIDAGFNASLTSVGKFKGVLGDDLFYDETQAMVEKIIFWGTVYGNDKKFLKERIESEYKERLTNEQIKRIVGFKFNGWGKLSKTFLELQGDCECGECSLIQALWETNHNLMELLSEQYGFKKNLDAMTSNAEKALSDWTIEDLDGKYLSAPVKRMVWQTMKMLKEVCELTGKEPDKVFIEMPREHEKNATRKNSRKKKLLDLYTTLKSEQKSWAELRIREIDEKSEADFRVKKLYLYYLQQGKCMYSGETIELSNLMNNNLYDIDHIYPRHFIKDDSIENNLVLVKKQINNHKSDTFPLEKDIQKDRAGFWKALSERGFITKEKYNRLTRTEEFSDEEKAAFINRQLVETGQGTKAITQVLQQAFPNTQVVFVKAGLVSDFRKKFEINKVRALNDTHHAKDAYLNIVVGNTYNTKFTSNPINFIKDAAKKPKDEFFKYHMDKIFEYNVSRNGENAWVAEKGISKNHVLGVVNRNTVIITRKTEENHGALSNKATVWGKDKAKGNPEAYMPVKSSDSKAQDVTKYGGITSIANSGYTLVEYKVKGKIIRSLEAIPVYLGRSDTLTNEKILGYLSEALRKEYKGKEVSDLRVCVPFIPQKSKVKIDGFYYYIGGKTGNSIYLNNDVPLYLSYADEEYLRKIIKAIEKANYEEINKDGNVIITKERNYKLFKTLELKLCSKPYDNNRWNIYKSIKGKEDIFESLDIEKQCFVINQIIFWINSTTQNVNLKYLKGSEHAGTLTLNKKISECNEFVLIHQSITGMYERKIDLLTV